MPTCCEYFQESGGDGEEDKLASRCLGDREGYCKSEPGWRLVSYQVDDCIECCPGCLGNLLSLTDESLLEPEERELM
ncbi:hypothetical protein ACFOU2_22245 [Bacillus songklensis]|uniref:Uncharacterized protein n=1 Tax=Bacillus songklensis TaxID=1069116 RepID=A0ABV8B9J4_9BACI